MRSAARLGRGLILLAAVWALGASLVLFFLPQTVETITATGIAGEAARTETLIEEKSWYEIQGLWGSAVLVLFAGFYAVPVRLVANGNRKMLIMWSLLALALAYLTGFTVGLWYMPAALSLVVGALLSVSFKH